MTTLYIDHKYASLEVEGQTLVARLGDKRQRPVPLALLERVVCLNTVKLDTGVLGTLAEHGVAFSIASQRKPRRRAVLLGSGHNDAGLRLLHYRLAQDAQWRVAFLPNHSFYRLRGRGPWHLYCSAKRHYFHLSFTISTFREFWGLFL